MFFAQVKYEMLDYRFVVYKQKRLKLCIPNWLVAVIFKFLIR